MVDLFSFLDELTNNDIKLENHILTTENIELKLLYL